MILIIHHFVLLKCKFNYFIIIFLNDIELEMNYKIKFFVIYLF